MKSPPEINQTYQEPILRISEKRTLTAGEWMEAITLIEKLEGGLKRGNVTINRLHELSLELHKVLKGQ